MLRVKALQYMYYQRTEYQKGDEYVMDDREENDAIILEKLGKIQILEKPAPNIGKTYKTTNVTPRQTTELKAEEPKQEEEGHPVGPMTTEEGKPLTSPGEKRYYRRRDMKPEK